MMSPMAAQADALLPPHVTLLGQALTPSLQRLERQLKPRARLEPSAPLANFAEVAEETLSRFGDSSERLVGEVGRLDAVVNATDVADAEVHRVAGRVEMVLDELLGGYAALRNLQPASWCIEGHELLLAALRHPLMEIRDWLRELVDTFAEPAAAVEKHRLPNRDQVTLHLALTLTAPPALEAFTRWLEEQEGQLAGNGQAPQRGKWDGLLALVAGLALGGLFFGGDDELYCGGDE